jgi:uncharacterized protein YjbJ (UPF0337 family)
MEGLTERRTLMGKGTGDKAEGKWDETKGKVKEKYGEVTDNPTKEAEGKKDQVKGEGKQAWGNVKEAGQRMKEAVSTGPPPSFRLSADPRLARTAYLGGLGFLPKTHLAPPNHGRSH